MTHIFIPLLQQTQGNLSFAGPNNYVIDLNHKKMQKYKHKIRYSGLEVPCQLGPLKLQLQ